MFAATEQMKDTVVCSSEKDAVATECFEAEVAEGEFPVAPLNESEQFPKQCPKGHTLSYAPARAGVCDRCLGWVPEGQLVSDCKVCNWYLCTRCTPITECPQGHSLRAAPAPEGKCDGCGKKVKQGEMVMECRDCNFYLCDVCQPLTQCPSGHELKPWTCQRPSRCGRCSKLSKHGDMLMACGICEWHLCGECHPKPPPTQPTVESAPAEPLPQCPQGHDAVPRAVGAGITCNKCTSKVPEGRMASTCSQCDWDLCTACHPIRQCKLGHKLEARPAPVPGTCDGCGVKVLMNQSVLDCRRCNWYLCGFCYQAPAQARGGA